VTIQFPPNPVDGDLFSSSGRLFRYTSPPGVWESVGEIEAEADPVFSASDAFGYTEAPQDGKPYARQDLGWVAVPLTSDLDGGSANTVYTVDQHIDGGVA